MVLNEFVITTLRDSFTLASPSFIRNAHPPMPRSTEMITSAQPAPDNRSLFIKLVGGPACQERITCTRVRPRREFEVRLNWWQHKQVLICFSRSHDLCSRRSVRLHWRGYLLLPVNQSINL